MGISDIERDVIGSWQALDSQQHDLSATIRAINEAMNALDQQNIRAPADPEPTTTFYSKLGEARDILQQIAGALPECRDHLYAYVGRNIARPSVEIDAPFATPYRTSTEYYSDGLPPLESLPEYSLLIGANIQATPEAAQHAPNDPEIEAKRTKLTDDCLREGWSGTQQKLSRLTPEEFAEYHRFVREACNNDPELFAALRYWGAIHDIGKNPAVRTAVGAGEHVDHDEVFRMLLCDPEHEAARQQFLPSLVTLSERGQAMIRNGTASGLNYPQTLQGEAPAASLLGIHNETDPVVRDTDIVKSIVDIAGALGHITPDKSLSLDSNTWRRMKNLNAALRNPELDSATARSNAFLDAEWQHFLGPIEVRDEQHLNELRTLARLGCHLRIDTNGQFAELAENFDSQNEAVKAILTRELNRDGITERATLPYYGPTVFRSLIKQSDMNFGVAYYAHILQEAHLLDKKARASGKSGTVMAEMGDAVKAILSNQDLRNTSHRFTAQDDVLVPHHIKPKTITEVNLPSFEGEHSLRGKRVLFVGIGGGSDGVHAALMRKLLKSKYGIEEGVVVSVRNEKRKVENTGESVGRATKEVTPDTRPVGDWRYLEDIPLEGSDPARTFLLNSADPETIKADLQALIDRTGADVVVGVDSGGDSLYRTTHGGFSAVSAADITPDQDRTVLKAMGEVAAQNQDVRMLTTIVAPGIDSPPYAADVLDAAEATELPLSAAEVAEIERQYEEWRMDGSGNTIGRYGKTPLAWLLALQNKLGLQPLDLPPEVVTSDKNPWRAFAFITPAMRSIVLMDLDKHLEATREE